MIDIVFGDGQIEMGPNFRVEIEDAYKSKDVRFLIELMALREAQMNERLLGAVKAADYPVAHASEGYLQCLADIAELITKNLADSVKESQ